MSLTIEQRIRAIDALVQQWADNIDMGDLLDYYMSHEQDLLETESDERLLEHLEYEDIDLDFEEEEERRDEKNGLYPDKDDIAN